MLGRPRVVKLCYFQASEATTVIKTQACFAYILYIRNIGLV